MPKFETLMVAGVTALHRHISPFAVINLLVSRAGYQIHRGLAYGAEPRQKLDIYVPSGLEAPAPVVLFFYGGGWQSGDRADYLAFGQAFASAGIVVVVADYRLYPQVKYPGFIEDWRARWPLSTPAPHSMAAIATASSSPAIQRAPTTR